MLPSTQHDVVVWLAGAAYDLVFDVSGAVVAALASHATLAHEMVGWPYHLDRDLTGFERRAREPDARRGHVRRDRPVGAAGEGGSVLLLQQWAHDFDRWAALTVEQQEAAMGRRKATGEELDPKPDTSHVARTDQDTFGKIFRRNIGYGTLTDHGTIFVGIQPGPCPA